jgi:hypothetical protein
MFEHHPFIGLSNDIIKNKTVHDISWDSVLPSDSSFILERQLVEVV